MIRKLEKDAKKAWYDTRVGYHQTKRKLSDLIWGAQQAAGSAKRVVRESQKGYDFIEQNAPEAKKNIREMMRKLKKK